MREQVTTRVEDVDSCTCVPENSCSTDSIVRVGVNTHTTGVRVNVNPGGVNVNVNRRGRRDVGHIFDAFFGPPARSANYASIFDFIPKIDVNVNRHGWLGNRGVNVNIGNGHGIRVGVNRNNNPFFTFGLGPSGYDVSRNAGYDPNCPNNNCGGPVNPVRPTRRRVSVTPTPTPRCQTGQVSFQMRRRKEINDEVVLLCIPLPDIRKFPSPYYFIHPFYLLFAGVLQEQQALFQGKWSTYSSSRRIVWYKVCMWHRSWQSYPQERGGQCCRVSLECKFFNQVINSLLIHSTSCIPPYIHDDKKLSQRDLFEVSFFHFLTNSCWCCYG